MLSVDEAVGHLLESSGLLVAVEETLLVNALGRVLAEDVIAGIDVPPADNSAMDGYAFRRSDWCGTDQAIPLSQRIPAGISPPALVAGTAARIFTGAEIPEGADTVVMQEHCTATDGGVFIQKLPDEGKNIRRGRCRWYDGHPAFEIGQNPENIAFDAVVVSDDVIRRNFAA